MPSSRVLGIRFQEQEILAIEAAARLEHMKPSDWAKKVLLAVAYTEKSIGAGSAVPPPARSWAGEWAAMEQMDPQEAMERLDELRAGRAPLPANIRSKSKPERLAWLESHWPLEDKRA
jgi:hypothetical protein